VRVFVGNAAILIFAEINVEDHAEGGDGTEEAKKNIPSILHVQRFVDADGAGDEAADDGKADDGFGAGVAIDFGGLIVGLGGHKSSWC